ncbi:MAG TPA: EAL domain-containing response regulator, partial [Alphaproteobacteria bacterium]|nr:EAL domain-containing response regulator [Alphaproteobacteria bacterium]
MDGLELLRWLAGQNCRAQIVIMSGFDGRVLDAARRVGEERGLLIRYALQKPIHVQDLKGKFESLKETRDAHLDRADLARAIAGEELFLLYQPKVDLKTATPHGTEALLRWQHPALGPISADQFTGLAEESGQMAAITDFVLRTAVQQQKIWRDAGIRYDMAVNLSPSDLRDERFADRVASLCESAGVPPDCMTLEITETLAMSHALEALDILTRLRLKGFRLSIDDFGTGFSSLSRLRRLPVTEIKIDRSFVGEAVKMSDAFVIVKAIADLARNMQMISVAEGI